MFAGNLGKGYEQVHSALLTTLEAIGVVHLTISSISQGSKLVTDWKTSRLPLAEPSKVIYMLQMRRPLLFSCPPDIFPIFFNY